MTGTRTPRPPPPAEPSSASAIAPSGEEAPPEPALLVAAALRFVTAPDKPGTLSDEPAGPVARARASVAMPARPRVRRVHVVDSGMMLALAADASATLGHPPRAVGTFSTYSLALEFPGGTSLLNLPARPPECADEHLLDLIAGVDAPANRTTVIATVISPARAAKTPFPIWAVRIRPSWDVCAPRQTSLIENERLPRRPSKFRRRMGMAADLARGRG